MAIIKVPRKRMLVNKSKLSVHLMFLSIFTLGTAWVIFQPPFASVDEPAHASRAYTAVHGQAFFPINKDTAPDAVDEITVPNWIFPYAEPDSPYCFWTRIDVTANCAQTDWTKVEPTKRPNQFAQYFPTFYFIAGLPSLLAEGQVAYYLMRFFGMLTIMLFIFLILRELHKNFSPKLIGLTLIAITPMSILGSATLAPLALETVSVVMLTLLLFRFSKKGISQNSDLYLFLITLFVSLTARPSGLIWNILIWGYFIFTKQLSVKNFTNSNIGKIFLSSSLIVIIFSALYLFLHRPKVAYNLGTYKINALNNLSFGVQSASEQFNNMIGIFGRDVYIPHIFYYLSFGVFSYLFFTNLFSDKLSKLSKIYLSGVAFLILTLHIFADYYYKDIFAHIWIGRYTTPLLAFFVVICVLNSNFNLWLFASYGILINLAAIWISYIRYSIGLTGGSCCGVKIRLQNEFQWYPLGQGIGTLTLFTLIITFSAFASFWIQNKSHDTK
jgi:hypothetical protein